MYSSDDNTSNSIRSVLFDAALKLSIPTVASTASLGNKIPTYSIEDESIQSSRSRSSSTNSRHSLSTISIHSSRRSTVKQTKILRDVATQSSPSLDANDRTQRRPSHLNLIVDNNNNPTMTSTISATSKEYLSVPEYHRHHRSPSMSPTRNGNSLKTTLLGIWQGLNSDEMRSAAASPIDPKFFDEKMRLSSPSWKFFSKVVTSLLTFTRTKQGRYEWIQLVGHPGTFREGVHDGYVLKELCEQEQYCCELLQKDILKDFVPRYNGRIEDDEGKNYIEMEDLLASFEEPCIMDCKIGVRTYLEEELDKSERDPKPRSDLYEKMISIDPTAPTEQEHQEKKILKPRYMIWRESLSSSQQLGFRIEAIKKSRGLMSKEFQRIKEREDVRKQLADFIGHSIPRAIEYLQRLRNLRAACLHSKFFQSHELIGSSLLFVHDAKRASVWMIDFGKTRLLPPNIPITHSKPWVRGTHEDGYLIGLDNLIALFQEIIDDL